MAENLINKGVSAEVIDLRTVVPLDKDLICKSVSKTGRLLVVDEDYTNYGLTGEIAAVVLEAGITVTYGRIGTDHTIPFSRNFEYETLPNTNTIIKKTMEMINR